MSELAQEPPVPWDQPRQDPLFMQLSDVHEWTVLRVDSDLWRHHVGDTFAPFAAGWPTWRSSERRAAVEALMLDFCRLLQTGDGHGYTWILYQTMCDRVGRLRAEGWPALKKVDNDKYDEVAGRIATIADVYPFDSIAERRRWEFSFFHPGRMTPNKLQRTSDVEWAHMLSELNALPRKLLERVLCLRSLGESPRRALPTADALFLDAFDASQTPQSRFHRFTALLDGILGLYRLAVGEGHQQEDSVRRLADAIETASKSHQKPAFANESLAVQVSGVDEARNLLFETCKHYLTRTLLSPDRVARRISPRSVAMATETDHFEHATQLHLLAQALPGIVLNAQPHDNSLGKTRSSPSRYDPVPRRTFS